MSATQKVQQHPAFIQAQAKANYYVSQLDKELTKYPLLTNFEQRTQIPKSYAFIGAVIILGFFHSINTFAAPVSNLVGWALPAYLSVKALESPSHQDDIQWLTYWVVFGYFNFLESFALRIVLYYVPWYFAFKSIFILWLQLPAFRGAETLYATVVKPVFANLHHKTNSTPTQSEVIAHPVRSVTLFNAVRLLVLRIRVDFAVSTLVVR
ncbi:Protein YOP1 [Grifola frondosa]|uniref:Protein YOP1 n=1 Tax=Grifola frondosa TaxID=5627 RepID=A0A1C7MW30_GRIFR|nr:Protein YOP1 [Grifola frondosa]